MTRKLLPLICLLSLARGAWAQETLKPEDILGQDREITLQQAIALGLEYNLGLQLIRNEPALARERVREYEGAFQPNLDAGFVQDHVETPVASSVQSFFGTTGNSIVDDGLRYTGGLTGILPWGPAYSSGYTYRKLSSTSGLNSLKPQYTADWTSRISIPLLRDLYWSTPDLLVRRSIVQQDVSDAQFNSRLADGIFLLEQNYWALSAARALERATSRQVDTAKDLLEQTKVQYQVGVVSKVNVTQAEANLAQRESQYIIAVNAAMRAQDDLLTAILAPDISDYSSTTVRTEEPSFVPYPVDPVTSLEKARANRSELLESELVLRDAEILEKYAWNQKLPAFDVGASYTMSGLSGKQKVPAGTPVGFRDDPNTPDFDVANVAIQPDFGFGTSPGASNEGFFAGDGFHSWGFNALFSYPLGNDTADARYVQRKIELRRAKTSLRRTEQDITLSVRAAVRELQSAIDRAKAAERQRIFSEESLRAEEEKLRLGDATPHDVQEFQDNLLQAEANEITALQAYRSAISALERAQGTLLEARGVSVVGERERGMDQY